MALDENVKQQGRLILHLHVGKQVVVQLANGALDQNGSVQHGTDVESNHEIVGNAEVHLLRLDL